VQFVDEEDDVLRAADLGHDRLDPLLELPAVLRARDHHREVEHDDPPAAKNLGDVAGDDVRGEPLDDGGLADTGLAEQHRVVLRPPGEDLHHPLDLVLPADDRVELLFAGEFGQVAAEGVERRRLRLAGRGLLLVIIPSAGIRDVGAEQLEDLFPDLLQLDLEVHEDLGGDPLVLPDQAEEQVLRPDVVVAEVLGLLEGELENLLGARREGELSHRHGVRAALDDALHLDADLLQLDFEVLQDLGGDATAFLHQSEQDVLGPDVVVPEPLGLLAGEAHDLAGPLGESVKHVDTFRQRMRNRGSLPHVRWDGDETS